jgi:cysteine synthase
MRDDPANEANPDMHSRTTAREIIADFAGERLDYWVTGYGTRGTFKGVARVLARERPTPRSSCANRRTHRCSKVEYLSP